MSSSFSFKVFSLSLAWCALFLGQTTYAQAFPLEEGQHLPPVEKGEAIRGSEGAEITMVEYADYECPFCKMHHKTMRSLLTQYPGKVNWVLRQYPLPFHPMAQPSAQAAVCVLQRKGGRAFWKLTDSLFSKSYGDGYSYNKYNNSYLLLGKNASSLRESDVRRLAARNGLPKKDYDACQKDFSVKKFIGDEISKGTAAGVQGTPTTFLIQNRTGKMQKIVGYQPIQNFKDAIDALLKF